MIDRRYLLAGFAALCRIGSEGGDPNQGHWPAAVLAACFLSRDQRLSAEACRALARQLDALMSRHVEWFGDVGGARSDPDREAAERIARALEESAGRLHALGHNVIFGSLALRAVRVAPQGATADRVEGLVALLRSLGTAGPGGPFSGWAESELPSVEVSHTEVPEYDTDEAVARTSLETFAGFPTIHGGRHSGVVGHVLTLGHAVLELRRWGFPELAARAAGTHRLYVKLARRAAGRPDPDSGPPLRRSDAIRVDPAAPRFWGSDLRGRFDWAFGHVFKYTYSFCALLDFVSDPKKRRRYRRQLDLLLAWR